MAEWIVSFFPKHRIYVEPFGGAASVLLCKQPADVEIYNDIDDQVVNVMRVIRDQPQKLQRYIKLLPYSRTEFHHSQIILQQPRNCDSNIARAAYTILAAYAGYGSSGLREKNTGFRGCFTSGSTETITSNLRRWKEYPSRITTYTKRLSGILIENMDALEIIQKSDHPSTLIYIDPPYEFGTRTGKKNTYRHEFTDLQHQRLLEIIINTKNAYIILSGYSGGIYDTLAKQGWQTTQKASRTLYNQSRTETLWLNPAVLQSQKQQLMELK